MVATSGKHEGNVFRAVTAINGRCKIGEAQCIVQLYGRRASVREE